MKKVYGVLMFAILAGMVCINFPAHGIPETKVDLTIAPGDYDGSYLPHLDTDTVDVKMISNIPVDVYILKAEQVYNIESEDFEYEKKWEGRTSLNVDYTVDDVDTSYYIMVENPSETETAYVELEYKVLQEIGEEIAKDICCGMVMIAGIVSLLGLVVGLSFLRKRNI